MGAQRQSEHHTDHRGRKNIRLGTGQCRAHHNGYRGGCHPSSGEEGARFQQLACRVKKTAAAEG